MNESLCSKTKHAVSQEETSDTTRLVDLQEAMQKMMSAQMEQQVELLSHIDRK